MKLLPPIAAISGFCISALTGYSIKDYLDRATVHLEISEMGYVEFADPSVYHRTPLSVIDSYNNAPMAVEIFDEILSVSEIRKIIFEVEQWIGVTEGIYSDIEEIDLLLSDLDATNLVERRQKIAQIAADSRANLFDQQMAYALRRGRFMRRIQDAKESDPLHKFQTHPVEWKNTSVATLLLNASSFDLSEVPFNEAMTSREKYDIFTENVSRRMYIYLDSFVFKELLISMKSETDSDIEKLNLFLGELKSWLSALEEKRIVADIVLNNMGKRPATLDTTAMLRVAIGDHEVIFSSFIVDFNNVTIESPTILSPSSTTLLRLVSENVTKDIVLTSGDTLSELESVGDSKILSGSAGVYVRSSEGGSAIKSSNAFPMGASAREDQFSKIELLLAR